MIIQPAIVALLIGSALIGLMLLYASFYGTIILKRWDLSSGSEFQLELERRTYLISTMLSYAFGFQLISLFLFIYTTDHITPLFVGAMCAAGTLNVNLWGYPTIILKLFNFIVAGLWLIVNFADNRAHDYPLIKKKYGILLLITPFVLAEFIVQGLYFMGLTPDVITSCCGSLFSSERENVVAGLTGLPRLPMELTFYSIMAVTIAFGLFFLYRKSGGYLFGALCAVTFLVSCAAIISFISLYIYELPTHHCPFCILQREYGYIGYTLYVSLLGGTIAGLGVGFLTPFKKIESLKDLIPSFQLKLAGSALIFFGIYAAITTYCIIFSRLSFS